MMMKKSVSAIAAAAMLAVGLGMPTAAFAEELSNGAATEQTAPDGAQAPEQTTPGTGDEAKDPATEPDAGDEGATPETPGGAEGDTGHGETTDTTEDQVTKGTVSVFGYDGKELVATYTVEDGEVVYGDVYAQGEVISPDDVDGYLDSAEGLTLIGFEDAVTGARFGDEDTFFGLLKKQPATTLYGLYGESFNTPLEDTVSVVTDLAGVYIDTDKDDKSRFEGENGFSATKNYLTDANTALRISTGAKVRFHGMQKALDNGWAFAGGLADTDADTDDSTTDTPTKAAPAKDAAADDTKSDAKATDYVIPNGATINGESGTIDGVAYTLSKGDLRFNYQFLYDTPMSGDLTVEGPNADANKTDSDKLANTGSSIIAIAVAAIVVVAAAIALVVVKLVSGKKATPEVVNTTTAEEAPKTNDAKATPAEEAPKTNDAKATPAEVAPKSDDAKTE